jgi:hypothetical protein
VEGEMSKGRVWMFGIKIALLLVLLGNRVYHCGYDAGFEAAKGIYRP